MIKSLGRQDKPLDDARSLEFVSVQALRFQLALESNDEFELLQAIAAELAVIGDARRRIQLVLGRLPSIPDFDSNLHRLDAQRAYCLRAIKNALENLRTDRAIIADDLTQSAAEAQPDGDPRPPVMDVRASVEKVDVRCSHCGLECETHLELIEGRTYAAGDQVELFCWPCDRAQLHEITATKIGWVPVRPTSITRRNQEL